MNLTATHIAYGVIFLLSAVIFFFKIKLLHKQAYISRIDNFAAKALALSLVGNVFFVLCCAWYNSNEDMVHIAIVIAIAILFDVHYYQYCKRRAARYRDVGYHDITNDIRLK